MIFTDGYAASPGLFPTRAAIMTGKYPSRLHLTSHLQGASNRFHFTKVLQPSARLELPLEEVTIAELLRQQGYRTACIGKWHLGKTGFLPSDQGFDVSLAGDEAGSTNDFFFPAWKKKIPLDGAAGEYLTDRLTGLAVDFVESNKDRPFFLYLSHFAVHTPIQGKPDKVRKYDAKSRPDNPHNYGEYAAMIESVDESVGRVLVALQSNGLLDNTLVIFTSDNGGVSSLEWKKRPVTSNRPLRAGKGHIYEGGIRVPLLASWPGVIQPGAVCREPVHSVDFAPTLAELAGARIKADGVSIAKLLRGGTLGQREIFWHYPHYSPQLGRPAAAMRNGDYKFILFFEDERGELYNLRNDIGETQDLSQRELPRANAMRRRLEQWLRETRAQIPVPNPNFDPIREREPGASSGPVTAK
jgi:arylsulfatase A